MIYKRKYLIYLTTKKNRWSNAPDVVGADRRDQNVDVRDEDEG